MKRGDIILLKHCDTDGLGTHVQKFKKKRPYVIVSNDADNDKSPTINVVPISSELDHKVYPMHFILLKCLYTNLIKDSRVLPEQILTIDKELIDKKIGRLIPSDIKLLNKVLSIQLLKR